MIKLGLLSAGLGYLTMVLGGLMCAGIFFYSIYVLIFESIAVGLMGIGLSVVVSLLVRFASVLLINIGNGMTIRAVDRQANG